MESLKASHTSDEEPLAQPKIQLQSVQKVNILSRIFLDLTISLRIKLYLYKLISLTWIWKQITNIEHYGTFDKCGENRGGKIENVFSVRKAEEIKSVFKQQTPKRSASQGNFKEEEQERGQRTRRQVNNLHVRSS